jgi:hypothetical protein
MSKMPTPIEWLRRAAEAIRHEQKDCECGYLDELVPEWTAEDEINLAKRVVAAQEAQTEEQDLKAERLFLRPINPDPVTAIAKYPVKP